MSLINDATVALTQISRYGVLGKNLMGRYLHHTQEKDTDNSGTLARWKLKFPNLYCT